MQPCLDDFYTTFDDYAQMHGYHARQTRESKWTRNTVSGLHIEPLDEASPLYTDGKAFAPEVSQMAVADTAKNLGLALRTEDGYLPIRNTAYKSLLDRAKIGGSALPKLKRPKLAGILNECLSVHKSEALLLVRNEKVAAFHSGDARDYSVLPIDALMTSLCEKLNAYLPILLSDKLPAERALALRFGLELLEQSDMVFVCGKLLSTGMKGEIARAVELSIPIIVYDAELYLKVRKLVTRYGGDKAQVKLHNEPCYLSLTAEEILA